MSDPTRPSTSTVLKLGLVAPGAAGAPVLLLLL